MLDFMLKLFISYFLSQIIFLKWGISISTMILTLFISFIVFIIIDSVGGEEKP